MSKEYVEKCRAKDVALNNTDKYTIKCEEYTVNADAESSVAKV